jgi:DNA-binding MarR family transcriptional regulator
MKRREIGAKECRVLLYLSRHANKTPDELVGRRDTRGIRRGEIKGLLKGLERKGLVVSYGSAKYTSPENVLRTLAGRPPKERVTYTLSRGGRLRAREIRERGGCETL